MFEQVMHDFELLKEDYSSQIIELVLKFLLMLNQMSWCKQIIYPLLNINKIPFDVIALNMSKNF